MLLVGLQVGVSTVPAFAADGQILFDVAGDGEGFTDDPSAPLVSFHELAPGFSTSGEVKVKNDSDSTVDLVVQATNIRDDDNGCVRPESNYGDTTCGGGEGELGRWLGLTLTADEYGSSPRQLWSGSIVDLESGAIVTEELRAGAVLSLEMAVRLPRAAGNDTMTDQTSWDLRWTAAADTGEMTTEILGTELGTMSAGTGGAGIDIPFTGATVGLGMALLAVTVLLCGVLLMLVSRLRQPRWRAGAAARISRGRRAPAHRASRSAAAPSRAGLPAPSVSR